MVRRFFFFFFCKVSKIFSYKGKKKKKRRIYVAVAVTRESEVFLCVSVFRWVRWFPIWIFTQVWLVLLLKKSKTASSSGLDCSYETWRADAKVTAMLATESLRQCTADKQLIKTILQGYLWGRMEPFQISTGSYWWKLLLNVFSQGHTHGGLP